MALPIEVSVRRRPAPEPTSRAPLAWGGYRERSLVGIGMLLGGAALVAQTSVFTLTLGLLGSLLHATGWLVQPGSLRVRASVAAPAALLCWVSLGGPDAMWLLAALLPCWLVLRRRPPVALGLTAVPAAVGLALGAALPYVADKGVVFGAVAASIAACAAAARELALRVRVIHRKPRANVAPEEDTA